MVADERRQVLTFEFDKPRKAYDGKEYRQVRYQILAVSGDKATLSLENETRKTPEGFPVVWELVLVEPAQYRWRASHAPPGTYNDVVGKRCNG